MKKMLKPFLFSLGFLFLCGALGSSYLFFKDFKKELVMEVGGFKLEKEETEGSKKKDYEKDDSSSKEQSFSNTKREGKTSSYQLVEHLYNLYSFPSPKAVKFRPDGKEVWVTLLLNENRGVSVFDPYSGQKIKDIYLDGGGGVEIEFGEDGQKAYVSQMETGRIFEIDAFSKQIVRTFDTQSNWTKVVYVLEDKLYASNWCGDNVTEIDLETGEVLRQIRTVDTPRGIYVTKDGSTLYVAGFANGEIQKVDLETGKSEVIFRNGGAMRHIVADEEKGVLFISDMANFTIYEVSVEKDLVKEFVKTDYNPNTIALSPDKNILYVSCRGINAAGENYYVPGPEWGSVLLFDVHSGKMLDAVVGGNQPTGLDVSPDGRLLCFSDFLDGRVEMFETPSYETLKQSDGGFSPYYKNYLRK